jgi:hypothetical protein
MASSESDRDEGAAPPSEGAKAEEVDSGWGSDAPAPPPTEATKPVEEPVAAAEEPPSPPAEANPAAAPSIAESPPAPPPVEPPVVASPPIEPLPIIAPPPTAPEKAIVAPAVEAGAVTAEPGFLAAFWSARPNGTWLAAGGGAIFVSLLVGILVGRGCRSETEPAPTASATPSHAPAPPPVAAPAPPPVTAPAPESAPEPASAAPRAPGSPLAPKSPAAAFDAKAAKAAIDKIVPTLKACKQPGEPPGTATVTVTFAHTGRVSDARVTTTRYAGTRTGTCIAQRLRAARVSPFAGNPVTVKRAVQIR